MKKKIAVSLEEIINKMIECNQLYEDYNSINVEVNKHGQYNHVWVHRASEEQLYRIEYSPNKPIEEYVWITNRGWTSLRKYE